MKFRKAVEDAIALELANVKRKVAQGEQALIDLQEKSQAVRGTLLKNGRSDAASVALHGQYLGVLSHETLRTEQTLVELGIEIDGTHSQLIQASKARKMITKLIEKGQAAQKESERVNETRLLDEAGITLYMIRREK